MEYKAVATGDRMLRDIYEYMKKLLAPYYLETEYTPWEQSYLRDVDGDGRTLFRNLATIGAYQGGTLVGFIQYGRSAFGFDTSGQISAAVSYAIIRNFYFDEACEEAGRTLLALALGKLNDGHSDRIYAFFHYFGMSCYARHGKLFERFAHIHGLLTQVGFAIEHENVYYSCRLSSEAPQQLGIACVWHGRTSGDQQYCDFMAGKHSVGGCEIHFSEETHFAYLRWIFTEEALRGKGVGSLCMAALKADLRKRGVVRLDTDTALDNTVAQHFYEKNAFRRDGVTRSYFMTVPPRAEQTELSSVEECRK